MRIAQLLLPNASEYDRKCQRVDFDALRDAHDVTVFDNARGVRGFDVAHVYGTLSRFAWLRTPKVTNAGFPEAVEERYFEAAAELQQTQTVGVFFRPSIAEVLDRTRARLARTREDVEWKLFDRVPTPEDIASVDVWFDPAIDDGDLDGFTAEALVMGRIVVASRNTINVKRLEKGRTGLLVPPHDANEATHAILAALFKPEVGRPRAGAARQTISKFKPRQRMRVLTHTYESLRS